LAKKEYNDDALTSLKGADKVRKRPSVIFGSDGLEGCQHAAFEIISNAVDEAREGFGSKVEVTLFADNVIEVRDYGRGIPMGWNARENKHNWELAFCTLYAGGKYDSNSGGNYTYSLGLNGLGLTATQMASAWMEADVCAGGKRWTLRFEKGYPVGEAVQTPCKKDMRGTRIRWMPDTAVFTDVAIPAVYFQETLHRQAVVNPGVHFYFYESSAQGTDAHAPHDSETDFFYENGIGDYVREIAGDDALTSVQTWETAKQGRDRADLPEYKVKLNAALCFHRQKQCKEYYHNASFLEHGGAPEKAAMTAFTGFFDNFFKSTGRYNKADPKVKFQDVTDCMLLVLSSFSTVTSYANQTKKAINNKFIQDALTEWIRHQMEVYFIENPLDADRIAEQVLINMRSRVKAEQTRVSIKKTMQSGTGLTNRVQKFVDCRSRDKTRREIYIVEGDSALGACKQARDSDFQAIIPVRGKILNCLKADHARIFKNDIILDLIRVLGCGIEMPGKAAKEFNAFDLDALNWSKVVICTDADVDGFQIRTLILTMIYRLMPGLITHGKVFIAESPLYEITAGDETWFCYTEREKAATLTHLSETGRKHTIQRSKGLGENDADMMSLTTMNPATRRLIQIFPADAAETAAMFDLMEGDNLAGRKAHIAAHGHEYLELADVS
jgi:DNA gyrase subunit B